MSNWVYWLDELSWWKSYLVLLAWLGAWTWIGLYLGSWVFLLGITSPLILAGIKDWKSRVEREHEAEITDRIERQMRMMKGEDS